MGKITIKSQDDLDIIIGDTKIDGAFIVFYEMLQKSLEQYSDKRIDQMRNTLIFIRADYPGLYNSEKKVEELSKLEIIYLYSQFP